MTLHSWIVTTKRLKPWDAEWLLGSFPYESIARTYEPVTDTTWTMPIDSGQIDIGFAGSEYTSNMSPHWIAQMKQRLSKPLRPAKLASFITMEYRPGHRPDYQAAWFDMIKLARVGAWHCNWSLVLCRPSPEHTELQIFTAEETEE